MAVVETVTILFTDLVGSTELGSRVGPEQAEALRQEHFALLREAVAAAGGREVKNLGDGLVRGGARGQPCIRLSRLGQTRRRWIGSRRGMMHPSSSRGPATPSQLCEHAPETWCQPSCRVNRDLA